MAYDTYTVIPGLDRFDCSSGGASYCMGCYTMEKQTYGDWVRYEDYLKLVREIRYLRQYGNKDCTSMADAAMAANELEDEPSAGAL